MSRQDVLALLREQEGAFVSGEEISHRLGLSRAAIWKAVDALRREGYTVEARTGRGYRLLDAPRGCCVLIPAHAVVQSDLPELGQLLLQDAVGQRTNLTVLPQCFHLKQVVNFAVQADTQPILPRFHRRCAPPLQ